VPSCSNSPKMNSSSVCSSLARRAIIDRDVLPPQDSRFDSTLSRWDCGEYIN